MSAAQPTTYLEKKVAGVCTYSGCRRPPAEGIQLCTWHVRRQRKRSRTRNAKERAAARAAGLCAICQVKPSKSYRCPGCLVREGRVPKSAGVRNGVDKSARIAAATRTHADGRKRYHASGKRGSQPAEKLDAEDLGWARSAIKRGEDGMALLRSLKVQMMPKIQRDDVKAAAVQQLILAQGHIADVLQRHGGKPIDRTRELQAKVDQLEERLAKVGAGGHTRQRHGRRDGE